MAQEDRFPDGGGTDFETVEVQVSPLEVIKDYTGVAAEPEKKAPHRFSADNQPATRGRRKGDKIKALFAMRERLEEQGFDLAYEIVRSYREAPSPAERRKMLELIARHTLPTFSKVEAEVKTDAPLVVMWKDDHDTMVQSGRIIDADAQEVTDADEA